MLTIGMLWYDDSKTATLEQKVQRAVEHYRAKFGVQPTACYVHPGLLSPDGAPQTFGHVKVRPSGTVIKHHFWLGVDDK
jgi:hypothetical protein